MARPQKSAAFESVSTFARVEALLATKPDLVLLVIGSPDFPRCAEQAELVREVTSDRGGAPRILMCDLHQTPELKHAFGVQGVPTILIFAHGQLAVRLEGVQSRTEIESAIAETDDR